MPVSASFRGPSWFASSLAVAGALVFGACSSDETPSSDHVAGTGPGSGGAAGAATGGTSATGGTTGGSTATGGTTGGTATAGSGGSVGGAAGSTATGGASGGFAAGGTTGMAGSSATGGSSGSSAAGAGGSGTAGGGAGGDAQGGTSGGGTSAGGTSAGGASSGGSGAGGSPAGSCPANATFCSGFEDANLPEGAVFKLNGDPATPWTAYFEVDTSVKKNGNSSLRVRSDVNGYKMLAVPTGGSTFWTRFYLQSDRVIGEIDHNVFVQGANNTDPNDGVHMEFGEDVGLSWHLDDSNIRWPEGYGRPQSGGTNPYQLDENVWYCVELLFDGVGRVHQAYIDGELLIDAQNFPSSAITYSYFKFGYNALHGTVRNNWYDDVAVAPTRVGCP